MYNIFTEGYPFTMMINEQKQGIYSKNLRQNPDLGKDHSELLEFVTIPFRGSGSSFDHWPSSTLSSQSSRQYVGIARGQLSRQLANSPWQTTLSKMMHGCFIWRILPVGSAMIFDTRPWTLTT